MNHELKTRKINMELKRKSLYDYLVICIDDLSYKELLQLKNYLNELKRCKYETTLNQSN